MLLIVQLAQVQCDYYSIFQAELENRNVEKIATIQRTGQCDYQGQTEFLRRDGHSDGSLAGTNTPPILIPRFAGSDGGIEKAKMDRSEQKRKHPCPSCYGEME
jgi:hypothetical protein